MRTSPGGLPLAFEENQGQLDPRVKYVARGSGYTLFLTAKDAVFALRSPSPAPQKDSLAAVYMQLMGGSRKPHIAASSELPGKSNYFIGSDRSQWRRGVKQYAAVAYRDIYPGIDLAFHGRQRRMEFDFIISPGADPAPIALRFSGADKVSTDDAGKLTLATAAGDMTLHPPVAYQDRGGTRQRVDANFVLTADNQITFALGAYDHGRELVIDPSVSYSTYLGGAQEDDGFAIAVDGSGNAYVTGQTKSTDFPTVTGAHSISNAGGADVFVSKISADGSTLLYSTYVGGSGNDSGNAIAVNAAGDALVAGGTASSDFPHNGGFQAAFGGGAHDAFVFELNPSGSTLTYSTYLGGTDDEVANGVAVDGSGNAYVVGYTYSTDFPLKSALQGTIAGISNGFVTKLNSSGSALVYSTYLGGGSNDFATAVAVDSVSQAYVTGSTQNAAFPTTASAFQKSCGTSPNCNGGLPDAFVSVYKADGSGFVYSTFLGGGNLDQGLGIAVDSTGSAYVAGVTQSNTDFPTLSPLQAFGGVQDAFVTKLNPAGSGLVYSTYLGGSQDDSAAGIAVDSSGNAYVTGRTGSSNFPSASATQPALNGVRDAFVSEISSIGPLVFSTFLGGSAGEDTSTSTGAAVGGIAVDRAGSNIYVTGNTISTDFPTVNAQQGTSGGGIDAFVVKFAQANFAVQSTELSPLSVGPGGSATATVSISPVNGFSGAVTLSCSVAPASGNAPTCGLNPVSIVSATSSTLTVATTASTPIGSYTITITGISGGFVHSATVSLAVSAPDFTVGATVLNPASVIAGASATSTVTVGALNGFTGSVALTCAVTPDSANKPTCSFNPMSIAPGTPSTLSVASTASTPAGLYTVTVTGTSGSLVHTTTVTLTVTIPDFTIGATALNPASVTPGNSATSTVTVGALSGFAGTVALTCAVTPATPNLPTCALNPVSVTPGTPSTLTVSTSVAATGVYTVTVTGTSGALVHSAPLTLTVNGPNFTIAGTTLGAVTQGGSTTSTITIAAVNGYTGTVNFTCSVVNVSGGTPLPGCMIPTAVSNGAGTSTLTVSTTGAAHSWNRGTNNIFYAIWLPVVALSFAGMRWERAGTRRKKLLGLLLMGLVVAGLVFLPACSSGGGGGGGCSGCTPKGSYTVNVTGTDSANSTVTHAVSPALTLTVN